VERTVRFVRENFMVGIRYESLADLRASLKTGKKIKKAI